MSHSYAYKVDPASLMTLCPVCLHSFQDARKAFLRRADVHQQTKDICTYCQVLTASAAMVSTIMSACLRLTETPPVER